MSWYFFGGFSAYLSVPSGRRWNHSGCSFSHGWSGEHWIAKSSAISMPSSRARATSRSKSVERAEVGMDRVWPPSSAPIAHGLPTSPRFAVSALLRPLRFVLADRVDRRQVDDVEAELRELRQHLLDAGEAAPRAREELVPGAEARELRVDVDAEPDVELDLAVPVVARRGERLLERHVRRRAERGPRRARRRGRPARPRPCASPRPARTRCGRSTRRR